MAETKLKAEMQAVETSPSAQPRQLQKVRLLIAASVFVLAFAIDLYTMAPTVTLVDSGELILSARGLGVAHPPGFPLYVVLAHLATLLPLGNIAVRTHIASALFAALAAAGMTLLVAEAMLIFPKNESTTPAKKSGQ